MTSIEVVETSQLGAAREAELHQLVVDAFDGDFGDDDWEHALGGWHAIGVQGDAVIAHAAVVPRRLDVGGRALHTGYVEAVATTPGQQRTGVGSAVMTELATIIRRDFELGALSTGSHAFYAGLGWERWQGPTFVRQGQDVVRTPDEDDGIMVLRFGPSARLDVTASITCEARPGDDW